MRERELKMIVPDSFEARRPREALRTTGRAASRRPTGSRRSAGGLRGADDKDAGNGNSEVIRAGPEDAGLGPCLERVDDAEIAEATHGASNSVLRQPEIDTWATT